MSSFETFDAGKYRFRLNPEMHTTTDIHKILFAYTEDSLLKQNIEKLKLEEYDRLQELLLGLQEDWAGANDRMNILAKKTTPPRNGKLQAIRPIDELQICPDVMVIAVSSMAAATFRRFVINHANGYEPCPEVLTDRSIKGKHVTVIVAMVVEAFRELLEQGDGPFASALLSHELLSIDIDKMIKKSHTETDAAFQARRLKIIEVRLKNDDIRKLELEETAAKARAEELERRSEVQMTLVARLENDIKLLEEASEPDCDLTKQLRNAFEEYKAQRTQGAAVEAQLGNADVEQAGQQMMFDANQVGFEGESTKAEAVRTRTKDEKNAVLKKEMRALKASQKQNNNAPEADDEKRTSFEAKCKAAYWQKVLKARAKYARQAQEEIQEAEAERDAADARAVQAEAEESEAQANLVRTTQMNWELHDEMRELQKKNTELAQWVQALQELRISETQ